VKLDTIVDGDGIAMAAGTWCLVTRRATIERTDPGRDDARTSEIKTCGGDVLTRGAN
jgi:hypothetical protein